MGWCPFASAPSEAVLCGEGGWGRREAACVASDRSQVRSLSTPPRPECPEAPRASPLTEARVLLALHGSRRGSTQRGGRRAGLGQARGRRVADRSLVSRSLLVPAARPTPALARGGVPGAGRHPGFSGPLPATRTTPALARGGVPGLFRGATPNAGPGQAPPGSCPTRGGGRPCPSGRGWPADTSSNETKPRRPKPGPTFSPTGCAAEVGGSQGIAHETSCECSCLRSRAGQPGQNANRSWVQPPVETGRASRGRGAAPRARKAAPGSGCCPSSSCSPECSQPARALHQGHRHAQHAQQGSAARMASSGTSPTTPGCHRTAEPDHPLQLRRSLNPNSNEFTVERTMYTINTMRSSWPRSCSCSCRRS